VQRDLPHYVTSEEYCVRLNDGIVQFLQFVDVDKEDFPWDKTCPSDHTPVMAPFYVGANKISTIMAWNVLNKKFIKHLQKNEKNDNQRLGNHPIANMDPDAQALREQDVVDLIMKSFGKMSDLIICLQEASYDVIAKLRKQMEATHLIVTTRHNRSNGEIPYTNCNAVILPRAHYELLGRETAIGAEMDGAMIDKTVSEYFTLRHTTHSVVFNVLCVHLAWSASTRYEELFLGLKTPYPTIIAGDFNKGVRYPIAPDKAHMRAYRDERYKFPNPLLAARGSPAFSHVCYYQNVGHDTFRMLERFDHVVFMDPPISAGGGDSSSDVVD
jgi:hypothetical protein